MNQKWIKISPRSPSKGTPGSFVYAWYLVLLLVLKTNGLYAQLDNYWTWDSHALDFNYQTPKPGSSSGAIGSSICDSSGRLLFYCDGNHAYDRKNRVMPYFTGMHDIGCSNVIIIPKNKHEYYIFGTQNMVSQFNFLFYVLIDIRLNNGYGDVEKGQLGTLFYGRFYTVGSAAKNGGGYWLLSKNLDSIYAFPVDSNGIGKPVKSYMYEKLSSDKNYDPVQTYNANLYTIKSSHDNKMVITTCPTVPNRIDTSFSTVYAYDFNNVTGQFSNQRLLASDSASPGIQYFGIFYNCAFSPNDSLIYIAHDPPAPGDTTHYPWDIIYQFQRYVPDIKASVFKVYLGDSIRHDSITDIVDIKAGPDGKIYLAFFKIVQPTGGPNKLMVINYPDRVGNACNLNLNGPSYFCTNMQVGQGNVCYLGGFPLTVSGYAPLSFTFSGQCGTPFRFVSKADSIFTRLTWYMQDINGNSIDSLNGSKITYSFKKSGKYTVTLQGMSNAGYKKWYSDTILYTTRPVAGFSFSPGNLCEYNHIRFTDLSHADTINVAVGQNWQWDFGDSGISSQPSPMHIYNQVGAFTVKLTYSNGFCTVDTQMTIKILPAPKPGFTVSDSNGCPPLTVQITPKTSGTVVHINYDFGNGTNDTISAPTAIYPVSGNYKILQQVTGTNGCITKDSITIMVNPLPTVINAGTDSICFGAAIQLGNTSKPGYIYSWTSVPSDLYSNQSSPIDTPKTNTVYDLKETISATGCTDSGMAISCFVQALPVARFSFERTRGFEYAFMVKESKNVRYSFDFGDSQPLSFSYGDSIIYHTFPGNGTYKTTLTAISGTNLACDAYQTDTIVINEPFSLNIFPNPFGLQTDINYMLLKPAHVKISLTDDIGRQIGTLLDKQLGPGEYDTGFSGASWATRPGMYFVTFQLDDQLIVKKIIQIDSIYY